MKPYGAGPRVRYRARQAAREEIAAELEDHALGDNDTCDGCRCCAPWLFDAEWAPFGPREIVSTSIDVSGPPVGSNTIDVSGPPVGSNEIRIRQELLRDVLAVFERRRGG